MKNKKRKNKKPIPQFWKDRLINISFTIMVIVLIVIVWVIAFYCVKSKEVVPSFTETMQLIGKNFISAEFWIACGYTMLRSFIGFVISIVLATLITMWGKVWWPVRKFFDPIAAILRTLPTMAVILLVLVWAPAYIAPIVVTFGVVFPNCYGQIKAAVDTIDPNLITMAKVFNLSKKDRFYKIYFKQSLPYLLRCIGIDFSFSFKVMVSGECMAGTSKCIGELITKAKAASKIAELTALIIMAIVIAVLLDLILSQLVRITYKWNRKVE